MLLIYYLYAYLYLKKPLDDSGISINLIMFIYRALHTKKNVLNKKKSLLIFQLIHLQVFFYFSLIYQINILNSYIFKLELLLCLSL